MKMTNIFKFLIVSAIVMQTLAVREMRNREYEDVTYSTTTNDSRQYDTTELVSPRIEKAPSYAMQKRTVVDLSHHSQPVDLPRPSIPRALVHSSCPCAAQVRCKPCNIYPGPMSRLNPVLSPHDCPCAPKPNCPVCPPLSLLHEVASKKALQDQQMAYNLKNLSSRMAKFYDLVIKYSGDVVKHEQAARDAAKHMEESSIKGHLARRNMYLTSEKARFIARTGIVDKKPCGGIDCNMNPEANRNGMFGFFPDKVFPEEVDNIKNYMRGSFTTNVNGYTEDSPKDYELNRMLKDSKGHIEVEAMDVNGRNGFRRGEDLEVDQGENEDSLLNQIAENNTEDYSDQGANGNGRYDQLNQSGNDHMNPNRNANFNQAPANNQNQQVPNRPQQNGKVSTNQPNAQSPPPATNQNSQGGQMTNVNNHNFKRLR